MLSAPWQHSRGCSSEFEDGVAVPVNVDGLDQAAGRRLEIGWELPIDRMIIGGLSSRSIARQQVCGGRGTRTPSGELLRTRDYQSFAAPRRFILRTYKASAMKTLPL